MDNIQPQKPLKNGERKKKYIIKFFQNLLLGAFITVVSLLLGMWGYHYFESMDWIDAYANAAMILSGMGPLKNLETYEGKIFAGTYALFSGVIYLVIVAIIFAPIFHLVLHRFHIEDGTHR